MFGHEVDWDLLGRASNLIQIVSVFPWLLTAYLFWSRARKYKELMRQQEGKTSAKPKALAIGLVGTGDISGQVSQFLATNNLSMDIEPFYIDSGRGITKDNIQKLLRRLLHVKEKFTKEGITELHLFIAAPVAFGAAVGAIFVNWAASVKVYQYNKGSYEFWTILHKGFVAGIEDSLVKDLVDGEL